MSDIREMVTEMSMGVWRLSALSAALEAGLVDRLDELATPDRLAEATGMSAELTRAILDVLVGLELVRREGDRYSAELALATAVAGSSKEALVGELRSTWLQSRDMVERSRHGTLASGWSYSDLELLQAQGARSATVVKAWITLLIPTLEGLEERLERPGAAFLDVGVGVGAIAIAMCQHFRYLRTVGIDPLETALTESRRNAEKAGLTERIELRQLGVESMDELGAYDLAQLPTMFMSSEALAEGLRAVMKALRPGGWLILQVLSASGKQVDPSILRLVTILWGGDPIVPERAIHMLGSAGFVEIALFPAVVGPPVRFVVGRRPPLAQV